MDPHRKFVKIGLANQHTACFPQAFGHCGFIRGYEVLEHQAGAGGSHTLGAQIVFDRQWEPGKGTKTLTSCSELVDAIGFTSGPIRCDLDVNVEGRVNGFKPPKVLVNQLTGG